MLVFAEGGKNREPEEKPSEQGREPTLITLNPQKGVGMVGVFSETAH